MLQMLLAWADFLNLIRRPPHSLWFIFLVCLVVSLFSTLLNKLLVDHAKQARVQEVVNTHNKKKKDLLKLSEENPKRYKKEYPKWKRREDSIKKMQQSMMWDKMKPTCITFLPLIAFFYVIRSIYTPAGNIVQIPVAIPPMNAVDGMPAFISSFLSSNLYSAIGNITANMGLLGYTGWYMLCSMTLGAIIQRMFKVSQTMQNQSGSMFDKTAQMDLPDPMTL